MLRSLPIPISLLLSLALVADAAGKVALEAAQVCGAFECSVRKAERPGDLSFELLGPTIEARRGSAPPDSAGSSYRITLTTRPAPGNEVIHVEYFPDSRFLHVLGRPGTEAGGALLNTGWVRLTPPEVEAYDSLTAGVALPDAKRDEGDLPPWEILMAAASALALGAIGLIAARRRRSAPVTAPSS